MLLPYYRRMFGLSPSDIIEWEIGRKKEEEGGIIDLKGDSWLGWWG